jgi:hypothetical protein
MTDTRIPCRLFACVLAAGWTLTGPVAALEDDQDPWMTDRYEVEIIVFRHADQGRNTPEQATPASVINASPLYLFPEPAPDPEPAIVGPVLDVWATAAQRATPPVSFYLLDLVEKFPDFVPFYGDGLQLNDVYARLERLDAYEPLVHLAWVQPARATADAIPFQVQSAGAGEFSVSGTITLYKKRYVHLEVDLELEPNSPLPEAETTSWLQFETIFSRRDASGAGRIPLEAAAETMVHRLQESRRMRGVDAHYFDHPLFGVIARIREIDLDDDEAGGTG